MYKGSLGKNRRINPDKVHELLHEPFLIYGNHKTSEAKKWQEKYFLKTEKILNHGEEFFPFFNF